MAETSQVGPALDLVEAEVRDRVRRAGFDPLRDPAAVRRLIAETLAEYDERSLAADLPALGDHASVAAAVQDAVAGFGPLQRHLDDPTVEEIWINEPGRVFVARRGRSELTTTILAADQVRDLVERMLESSGRRVDLSEPFVDAALPDGSRLHVVIPEITRSHLAVNIRKFVVAAASLDELVGLGTLSAAVARFLEAVVVAGLNVLVSGATQAGKTTLLGCLASAVPGRERVLTVEEVFELRLDVPDWVALQTRQANLEGHGEIGLRRLIREALRMRPDRLVVGEVRGAEALDLLLAMNSGVPGMGSVHANSARDAVAKLCTLPLLAGENVGHGFVVPTVAGCVDVVVHLVREGSGRRRVAEVVAVPGRTESGVVEMEPVLSTRDGRLVWAGGRPPHPERFAEAGYDLGPLLAAVAG